MRHAPQRPARSTPEAGASAPAGGAGRRQRSSCAAVTKPSCGGSDSRYAPRPHHLCGSPKQCRCRWLTLRGAGGLLLQYFLVCVGLFLCVRCSGGRKLASEHSAGRGSGAAAAAEAAAPVERRVVEAKLLGRARRVLRQERPPGAQQGFDCAHRPGAVWPAGSKATKW